MDPRADELSILNISRKKKRQIKKSFSGRQHTGGDGTQLKTFGEKLDYGLFSMTEVVAA